MFEQKIKFMNDVRQLVVDRVPHDRLNVFLNVPFKYVPEGVLMEDENYLDILLYGKPLAQTDYDRETDCLKLIEVSQDADLNARSLAYATLHELAHAVRGWTDADDPTGGHDWQWMQICKRFGIAPQAAGNPHDPNLITDPVLGMQIDALDYPA
jgi:hypothetical protein